MSRKEKPVIFPTDKRYLRVLVQADYFRMIIEDGKLKVIADVCNINHFVPISANDAGSPVNERDVVKAVKRALNHVLKSEELAMDGRQEKIAVD